MTCHKVMAAPEGRTETFARRVGENYIEANEALSKNKQQALIQEATELVKIFSAILKKSD